MHRENEVVYVLYTSDVHAHWLRAEGNSGGSMACAASYAASLRKQQSHVWFIDNGDLLQGTPLANHIALYEGQLGPAVLGNALLASGIDMVVPGNHDMDYGIEYLQQVMAASSCLWIAANVQHCSGMPLTQSHHIASFGSRRVAFIGVTTRVPKLQYPEQMKQWQYLDEVDTVRKLVKQLRSQVDAIVVSYHGGVECRDSAGSDAENQALRMAVEVPEIDVLLTGHQHGSWVKRVGSTLMLQPGALGKSVGEISLQFVKTAAGIALETEGRIVNVTEEEEQVEVLSVLTDIKLRADQRLNQELCRVEAFMRLNSWHDLTRSEHPIIEWMHQVQLQTSGAELSAVAYPGSTTLLLESGALTRGDIMRIFPYMDRLGVYTIGGAALRAALEVSASWYAAGTMEPNREWLEPHLLLYQFVMFEGIKYTFDVARPIGDRLVRCEYLGRDLQDTDNYSIVMTWYLAEQAGKYPMFREMKLQRTLVDPVMQLLENDAASQEELRIASMSNWNVIEGGI